jgi:hypothetical protein
MKPLPTTRNRWPILALIALAAVFAGNEAVLAQRGQPRGGGGGGIRPGFQPGNQPRPGVPGQQQPRQQFVPPQPVIVPGAVVTVWTCSRCNREVGRGVKPALAQCPYCGAHFTNGGGMVAQNGPVVPVEQSPTFIYTLEVEGALLSGLVLVGLIRLVTDRPRNVLPVESGV